MEWIGPPRLASRSMSMTWPLPGRARAVTRVGLPKTKPPTWNTLRQLICPAVTPSVSINAISRSMPSCIRSLILLERRRLEAIDSATSASVIDALLATPARCDASIIRSRISLDTSDSLSASPAERAVSSTRRSSAELSGGNSPSRIAWADSFAAKAASELSERCASVSKSASNLK